ncbi:flagellar biosynthetic protein FliO [Paenibacillus aurantiacus]|uniref:Flagellar biosynthetic protein FliO n=1 Tax=Paenibacillus aurantiacus TaxID=1936118 RepID=A0ABV5KWV9_9BACL
MRRSILLSAGCASFGALLLRAAAAAADSGAGLGTPADPAEDTVNIPGSSMTGYLIWVVFVLLMVTVLIVIVIRWLALRNRTLITNRALRSLGGVPLGANKSLQIIDLSGRVYVVGVGENVALLDKIDDPEEARAIMEALEQQQFQGWNPASVKVWFDRLRRREKAEEPGNELWQEPESFQSLLQNRLRKQSDRRQEVESMLKDENQNDRLSDE